jgi:hypothetical protein
MRSLLGRIKGSTSGDGRIFDRIILDTQSPATAIRVTPYRDRFAVLLTPSDTVSGVDKTYFSLDGSEPTVVYNGRSFMVNRGATVKYYSVDNAGNREEVKAKVIP